MHLSESKYMKNLEQCSRHIFLWAMQRLKYVDQQNITWVPLFLIQATLFSLVEHNQMSQNPIVSCGGSRAGRQRTSFRYNFDEMPLEPNSFLSISL